MKPVLVLALAAALAAPPLASAQPNGPLRQALRDRMAARLRDKAKAESRPIDLQAIMPGATKRTLAYGPDAAQAIDVYAPPGARAAPIVVMVHGGAWKIGDKANTGSVENKLKAWLPKGFIVVSVNYRMLPQAMAYDQAQDVAAAVRFVQDHAAGWGGDPGRLVLMGHSAGAHLVALLSSDPAMVGRPWSGTVVLDSAVMSVPAIMRKRHLGFYDEAFGADPAGWPKASPMDRWTPAAVPMLLVCSTKRPDHPCDEARAFQALAEKAGRPMPVVPQPLSHADINRTLGLPGDYTARIEAFIDERLASGKVSG